MDLAAGVLTFDSFKKRQGGVYRSVPVPPSLLEVLDWYTAFASTKSIEDVAVVPVWSWSRMPGWRAVHDVMMGARLEGTYSSAKRF